MITIDHWVITSGMKLLFSTPGNKIINSRSKRTNKIAKKKNGVLKVLLLLRLSKPDSNGLKFKSFTVKFLVNTNWTNVNRERITTIIKEKIIRVIYLF